MISGFIVKKITMESLYDDNGRRLAVTRLEANPLIVTQVKTPEVDGYQAVQLAYGKVKRLDQPTAKKLAKIKIDSLPKGFVEFKLVDPASKIEIGQSISIDQVLKEGDTVDLQGISKGRGFAGVIKRHGFHRQPVSGGQSDRVRAPGSIGAQTPGKVLKGKKMPGHMGNQKNTVSGKIIKLIPKACQLLVSGPVSGSPNSWVIVKKS